MKQKLFTLLLILSMAFSLAGCADDLIGILVMTNGDAGVIGGADGPTCIIVSDTDGDGEAAPPAGGIQQEPAGENP